MYCYDYKKISTLINSSKCVYCLDQDVKVTMKFIYKIIKKRRQEADRTEKKESKSGLVVFEKKEGKASSHGRKKNNYEQNSSR